MTKRIRVIQIVNGLEAAGAERTALEIARSLPVGEFASSVMVVRDGPLRAVLADAGIPVDVIGGGFDVRWPGVVRRMAARMRQLAPDVVNTHMIGSDIVGGLAARGAGVPVILSTQHDTYRRPVIYDLFRRYSSRWLDAVVPVSPEMTGFCVESLHVAPERIHPIENCVDLTRFPPERTARSGPIVFGCLGSLKAVKGHEAAVAALAPVREVVPGARLLIAGEGPERQRLAETAADLGLDGAVELHGALTDVPAFLGEIDILVHPSRQEGLPLAVLEGMAAALPVIASDLSAIRRVLDDGRLGLLVPPGDVSALSAAMVRLADDPARREALGRESRTHVEARYSCERMAGEYAALYRELLGGKPTRASRGEAGRA